MIELNKVYTEGNVFRTPIAVMNNTVAYWFTSNQDELGKEVVAGYMTLDAFEKIHTQYSKPMTFQIIKDEGIKKLVDPSGRTKEVIGFSSNNKLVVFSENLGASSWREEEIKDWEVVE